MIVLGVILAVCVLYCLAIVALCCIAGANRRGGG